MMNQLGSISNIQSAQKLSVPLQSKGLMSSLMPFDRFYHEAVSALYSLEGTNQFKIEKKSRDVSSASAIAEQEMIEGVQVAQIPPGVNAQALQAVPNQINATPMQLFFDKTITVLERVSAREARMNNLIEGFVDGVISEDEVIIETAKFNLEMSMLVSIVQTAVQEFKGIQQIAV